MGKEPTCIMCGCQNHDACNHADFGACAWYSEDPWICSLCLECPGEGEGSGNYYETKFKPTPKAIKQWFKELDSIPVNVKAVKKSLIITLTDKFYSHPFSLFIHKIFSEAEYNGDTSFIVDINKYKMRAKL